jgi:hypothetical protein
LIKIWDESDVDELKDLFFYINIKTVSAIPAGLKMWNTM